jgi:hypothetical protein
MLYTLCVPMDINSTTGRQYSTAPLFPAKTTHSLTGHDLVPRPNPDVVYGDTCKLVYEIVRELFFNVQYK